MAKRTETRPLSALGLHILPFLYSPQSPSEQSGLKSMPKSSLPPCSSSILTHLSNSSKHIIFTHTCHERPQRSLSLLLLFWFRTKGLASAPLLAASPSGLCVRDQCYTCWLSHDAGRRLLICFRHNNKEQMPIRREEREIFWSGFLEMNFHAAFISSFIVFFFSLECILNADSLLSLTFRACEFENPIPCEKQCIQYGLWRKCQWMC